MVVTTSALGVQFHHAEGTAYGGRPSLAAADTRARAFGALRRLGFGERDVRQALALCATHVGANWELEPLLRQALGLLTSDSWAKAS